MNPPSTVQTFSDTSRYKPVPINPANRFIVDLILTVAPENSVSIVNASYNKFVKQAQLLDDGDVEQITYTNYIDDDTLIVRMNLIGVKNPELLKREIYHNLYSFVYNDVRKITTSIVIDGARLVDITGNRPEVIDNVKFR